MRIKIYIMIKVYKIFLSHNNIARQRLKSLLTVPVDSHRFLLHISGRRMVDLLYRIDYVERRHDISIIAYRLVIPHAFHTLSRVKHPKASLLYFPPNVLTERKLRRKKIKNKISLHV